MIPWLSATLLLEVVINFPIVMITISRIIIIIAFFVFADFISCLPPEKPRNIALIYSISLKRVQRWRYG